MTPCTLCGYHRAATPCPHCGETSTERSLAARPRGIAGGLWTGLVAVPRGLVFLFTTRGVKRWLLPPLLLTLLVLWGSLTVGFGYLADLAGEALPEDFAMTPPEWGWVLDLSERWEWFGAVVAGLTGALEWIVNHVYGLLANRASGFVLYAAFGFLVAWYVFSIAYEAFAGPFLDEIQGRFETKWFGSDPRAAIERPTELSPARCGTLTLVAAVPAVLAVVAGFSGVLPLWLGLVATPVPFALVAAVERDYGTWLAWFVRIEGRAVLVSVKASVLTALILAFTWPLYFVPLVGYLLFACVVGFATGITLLDIPCERRGWSLRQRLRFVRRHLVPFVAFGVVAGFLLAVPVVGALLMVPAASIGGLWLLCRLDKSGLGPSGASR